MRELYYMIDHWAGQQYGENEGEKTLFDRKYALKKEIKAPIGEGGQELLEALADLSLRPEVIHDEAPFQAALRFGPEIHETALN